MADGGWRIVTNCAKHTAGSVAVWLLAQRLWQTDGSGSGVSRDDNASFVSEVSMKIQK